MKTIFTFVFTLTVVLYFSSVAVLAQAKGQGLGPRVEHGKTDHVDRDRDRDRDKDKAEQRRDQDANREAKEGKFEERIERNPALRAKVASMLPQGANLKTAASGFKNQGQFIEALHASKNLNIPFSELKARMTGPNAMSLGQAVHVLRPNTPERQARQEAKLAEKQAKETEKGKAKPIT